MTGDEFIEKLAAQLANDLTANGAIKQFTNNSTLIGQYAEASVRRLIAKVVYPLRVSRGTIVWEGNCPDNARELDVIIWAPCPFPAIFEAGDFAIVPRLSAFAYLEVKSSNYSEVGWKMAETLTAEGDLISYRLEHPLALGVVCLQTKPPDPDLRSLIDAGRAVVLLEKSADAALTPNTNGIVRLVTFLMRVRKVARVSDGEWVPRYKGES